MDILRDIKGCRAQHLLQNTRFALLPLGSVEYHGRLAHLGTDAILADHFADFLDVRCGCVRFPTVIYTPLPGKTANYPGSITVRPETFLAYLCDILSGILCGGVTRILILNAHDGNIGLSRAAAERVSCEYENADILIVNWWQLIDEKQSEQELGLSGGGRGHGGAYEISAAYAALGEEFVSSSDERALPPVKLDTPVPHVRVQGRPENWEGRIGNPGETDTVVGKKILAIAQRNLYELINQWLER